MHRSRAPALRSRDPAPWPPIRLLPAAPAEHDWVHEIKYDGCRLQVRRDGDTVRLFTRRGYDWGGLANANRAVLLIACALSSKIRLLSHAQKMRQFKEWVRNE
jgi:ATP dependent DNA ligase domain